MSVAAPPRPAQPADSGGDAVQALIEEAKQRARRRRRTYGAIVLVVAVTAVAVTLAFSGSDTTRRERSGLDLPGGAAATVADGDELIASMFVWGRAVGGRDAVVYLYADGRLISTTHGHGFRERRLTRDGVEFVRADIISSGLFDPDQPPLGSERSRQSGCCGAQIQVRNGDRLVYLPLIPGREWTPDYLRLIERLRYLQGPPTRAGAWLPASAWANGEEKTYVPARYAVCPVPSHRAVLPAATAVLLETANVLAWKELIGEIDPAAHQRHAADPDVCFDLTTQQAQRVVESLNKNAELAPSFGHLFLAIDAPGPGTIGMLFVPVLPHGVPECFCEG